jgi:hypothetical protein
MSEHQEAPLPLPPACAKKGREVLFGHALLPPDLVKVEFFVRDPASDRPRVDLQVFGNVGDGEEA